MNIATVSTIIIGSAIAIIGGMAGLLQSMVVKRFDEFQAGLNSVREKHEALEIKVTRLQTEHDMLNCKHGHPAA